MVCVHGHGDAPQDEEFAETSRGGSAGSIQSTDRRRRVFVGTKDVVSAS
jgi:hypothetical protein